MTERLIIAMTGLAQSGKDTVGDHLAAAHGFAREAFADDIRRSLYGINPPVISTGNGAPFEMLADFVDRVGWDTARTHPAVHGLLHRAGTAGGWMIHGERLWIDHVDKRVRGLPKGVPVVVTDCRTPQEAEWVREHGGFIFRVDRAGQECTTDEHVEHRAEIHTVGHDFLIVNNGSLASLRAQVDAVLSMTDARHRGRR